MTTQITSIETSPATLVKASAGAAAAAALVFTLFVLPAETGIDPTGMGGAIGLTRMANAAETVAPAPAPATATNSLTQGTIATASDLLITPALQALAGEDVLVVATTGTQPPESVKLEPLPANARVEQFIPYNHLLPHVDVMVTNGGYGGVQGALAHGIPIVAAGKTEDKMEVTA